MEKRIDGEIETGINKYDIYDNLVRNNGIDLQMIVAIEELSELQKEITKRIRGEFNLENLIEEIADVEIVLEQLIHNMQLREEVNDIKTLKLIRTHESTKMNETK